MITNGIERMTAAIDAACGHRLQSVWLYGSVVLDDFRPGWSDIDMIALTESPLTEQHAETLLMLRQRLDEESPNEPYFRSFEGIICSWEEFQTGCYERLVYWGTSSQRITNRYRPDPFALYELARYGKCVFGKGDRSLFREPDRNELNAAVRKHYEGIRSCAVTTDESLYSCGWLLDIARCLYTLRHQTLISKTNAGKWALAQRLCPEPFQMEQTLAVRQNPSEALKKPEIHSWLKALGPSIQKFADILEKELEEHANEQMV